MDTNIHRQTAPSQAIRRIRGALACAASLALVASLVGCSSQDGDMIAAVRRGDVATVRRLLRANPALANAAYSDPPFRGSLSALHIALAEKQDKIAALLIQKGADVNSRNGSGETPLHYAVVDSDIPLVCALLRKGAAVNAKNRAGETALDWAVRYGRKDMAFILRKAGGTGPSPLHAACGLGDLASAKRAIVASSKSINVRDRDGDTPLHLAAANGHFAVVQLLLRRGSRVDLANNDGRTALHYASINGHEAVAKLLLDKGADANKKDVDGCTPLHLAAMEGWPAVATALIERGADLEARDDMTFTPLHHAAVSRADSGKRTSPRRFYSVAEALLKRGAKVNSSTDDGMTPLHLAAANGAPEMAELLLRSCAFVDARDEKGKTPLVLAVAKKHTAVVEVLRRFHASVRNRCRRLDGPDPVPRACCPAMRHSDRNT